MTESLLNINIYLNFYNSQQAVFKGAGLPTGYAVPKHINQLTFGYCNCNTGPACKDTAPGKTVRLEKDQAG